MANRRALTAKELEDGVRGGRPTNTHRSAAGAEEQAGLLTRVRSKLRIGAKVKDEAERAAAASRHRVLTDGPGDDITSSTVGAPATTALPLAAAPDAAHTLQVPPPPKAGTSAKPASRSLKSAANKHAYAEITRLRQIGDVESLDRALSLAEEHGWSDEVAKLAASLGALQPAPPRAAGARPETPAPQRRIVMSERVRQGYTLDKPEK